MNRTVKYQGAFSRIVGFAGKRFLFSPPPPPSTFFFCSRSNFRAITRLETLATQANRYQVNRLFQQDQKRVYQQMNGTSSSFSEVRPDAEETQQFWRDIWGKEVLHNENSEWLKELKKERVEARQEDIVITALCRMCGSKGETVAHVVSECGKLAQTDYKGRHDNVTRYIHWQLCGKCGLERANSWYEQKPEGVVERYCGISQSSVIGKLKQEDQTLSLLIRRRERLS